MGKELSKECAELKSDVYTLNEKLRFPKIENETAYLRLLLVGPKECGKTSVITSISAALSSDLRQIVGCRHPQYNFREYEIALKQEETEDNPQRDVLASFTLCDVDGFSLGDQDQVSDIEKLLKKYKEDANHTESLYHGDVSIGTHGHLAMVCFVAEASLFLDKVSRDDPYINTMKKIAKLVEEVDLPKAIILTKVDNIPSIGDSVLKIPRSPAVVKAISKTASTLGFLQSRIFPVKNFTSEQTVQPNVSVQFLKITQQLLSDMINVYRLIFKKIVLKHSEVLVKVTVDALKKVETTRHDGEDEDPDIEDQRDSVEDLGTDTNSMDAAHDFEVQRDSAVDEITDVEVMEHLSWASEGYSSEFDEDVILRRSSGTSSRGDLRRTSSKDESYLKALSRISMHDFAPDILSEDEHNGDCVDTDIESSKLPAISEHSTVIHRVNKGRSQTGEDNGGDCDNESLLHNLECTEDMLQFVRRSPTHDGNINDKYMSLKESHA